MIVPETQSDWLVKKNSIDATVTGARLIRQAAGLSGAGEHEPMPMAGRMGGKAQARPPEFRPRPPQERRIPVFGLAPMVGVMAGWRDAGLIAAFTAGFAMYGEPAARADDQASKQRGQICGGAEIARGTVGKILDGRTFVLDDGREILLAGIEVTLIAHDRPGSPHWGAAPALEALAGGDEIVLRGKTGLDRYGRLVGYAYVLRDGDEFLLQRELVAEGFARVGDRVESTCVGDLLSQEKTAREAKLGLWADPYYEVLDAESPKDALAHRGRFALVEGKVASVRESGPTIYVNFGRRRNRGHHGYDPETKRAQFRGGGS
jgi:endonuclease YncB( thermonuclease family)